MGASPDTEPSSEPGGASPLPDPAPPAPGPRPPVPLKVGILGAGRRGTALAQAAARLPDVTIVAVGDVEHARAAALAEPWGATVYSLWQSMLIFERLDALFIASPSSVHAEQTLTALDQGMHVYVERPPALDLALAERVGEAAAAKERIVHVGFQHRYSGLVEPWYQALDGRDIALVHAHLYCGLPEGGAAGQGTADGGPLLGEALHLLDLCRFLVDDVTSVAAHDGHGLWRDRPDWRGPDSSAVSLQFASGAAGTLAATRGMPLAIPGHLALDVVADGPLLLRFTGQELQVVEESGVRSWALEEPPDFAAVAAFLEAVRTGDRSGLRVPYDDALRTLRLALACRDSAESGTLLRL